MADATTSTPSILESKKNFRAVIRTTVERSVTVVVGLLGFFIAIAYFTVSYGVIPSNNTNVEPTGAAFTYGGLVLLGAPIVFLITSLIIYFFEEGLRVRGSVDVLVRVFFIVSVLLLLPLFLAAWYSLIFIFLVLLGYFAEQRAQGFFKTRTTKNTVFISIYLVAIPLVFYFLLYFFFGFYPFYEKI